MWCNTKEGMGLCTARAKSMMIVTFQLFNAVFLTPLKNCGKKYTYKIENLTISYIQFSGINYICNAA